MRVRVCVRRLCATWRHCKRPWLVAGHRDLCWRGGTLWRSKKVGGPEGLGGLVKDAPFNQEISQEWGSRLHVRLPSPSLPLTSSLLLRDCNANVSLSFLRCFSFSTVVPIEELAVHNDFSIVSRLIDGFIHTCRSLNSSWRQL